MDQLGFANDLFLSSALWRSDKTASLFCPTPSVETLKRLSMEAVLFCPPLVEDISTHLPQQLRKEMINIGLKKNFSSVALPLFYTWANPVLALRDILDTDDKNNGWSYRQICVRIIVTYLIEKVISIKLSDSKAVRLLDLTGCLVPRQLVEQLVETKWSTSERVTILLDVFVSSDERGHSKWLSLLAGSDHVTFKVNNLWVENVREAQRNTLLALASNQTLSGLKVSRLDFQDWPELYRGLSPLLQLSNLSRLDLAGNNLIDSSDSDVSGREWINKFLRKFPLLSRLELARNQMKGKVQSVLTGLDLSYLGLSGCDISSGDLAFILSIKSLQHLDISGLYQPFSLQPTTEHFNEFEGSASIETLDMRFWQPSHEEFIIVHDEVLKTLLNLQHLDISFCNFSTSQISKLLMLSLPSIEFHIICDSPGNVNVTLSELLKDHGYTQSNLTIEQSQWDNYLAFKAILRR